MNTVLINYNGLFLDKNGVWHHGKTPFVNDKISKFFHQNISRKDDGTYVLSVNGKYVPIEVEDVVLWIKDALINKEKSELRLYLSDGSVVVANREQKIEQNQNGEMYLYFTNGWKAKFKRDVQNYLNNFLTEENGQFFLSIGQLKLIVHSDS